MLQKEKSRAANVYYKVSLHAHHLQALRGSLGDHTCSLYPDPVPSPARRGGIALGRKVMPQLGRGGKLPLRLHNAWPNTAEQYHGS